MKAFAQTLRPRFIIVAALAVLTLAASLAPRASADDGVRFMREADSSFDGYLNSSSPKTQTWMRRHYYRMRGWAPYFSDKAVEWAPPTHFYKDLYAIYNDRKNYAGRPDLGTLDSHPNWVLKDSRGKRLFIPFACSGGTCPQLAADIGNPQFRKWWIAQAAKTVSDGYKGIFVDDVNLEWRVGDGNGNFVAPVDPRTGEPMTLTAWRRYFATFMEEIRSAFPKLEVTANPLWFSPKSNPSVRDSLLASDFIQLERGFSDSGITGGTGKYGYRTFLRHINWLHRRGKSVILKPYDLNRSKAEYELANYLLVEGRRDGLMSEYRADPGNFWVGWSTDLGEPRGSWRRWKGLFRRDYAKGMVLVNQPDAAVKQVGLPDRRYRDLSGERTRSVTLTAASGKVLTR